MSAAWSVAPDPNTGEDTLWREGRSVIRRSDLYRVTMPSDADDLFDVWARALAPDGATIERLAEVIHARMCGCPYGATTSAYRAARETLAALTGTAAQDAEVSDRG